MIVDQLSILRIINRFFWDLIEFKYKIRDVKPEQNLTPGLNILCFDIWANINDKSILILILKSGSAT